jgi:peroxidase
LQGCDGGLLIDGPGTEKTAPPNLSVKGYDVIAAVKAELERKCPGVVSCSDIQILATRDAVALAGGAAYAVRTGRRDRRRSLAPDVRLPAPEFTAAQMVAYFGGLGLSAFDAVLLLGAHTVGATRCSAIKGSRLYRYGGRAGATDPGMDPGYAFVYKNYVCPNVPSSDNNAVFLDDQWSALKLDNHYYRNLQQRRGVLACDQNLYSDGSTRWIVPLHLALPQGARQAQRGQRAHRHAGGDPKALQQIQLRIHHHIDLHLLWSSSSFLLTFLRSTWFDRMILLSFSFPFASFPRQV